MALTWAVKAGKSVKKGQGEKSMGRTEGAQRWESLQEADLSVLKTVHQGQRK